MIEQHLLVSSGWKKITSGTLRVARKIVFCNQSSSDSVICLALKSDGISEVHNREFLICGQTILANETLTYTFDLEGLTGKTLVAKAGNDQVSCLVNYD